MNINISVGARRFALVKNGGNEAVAALFILTESLQIVEQNTRCIFLHGLKNPFVSTVESLHTESYTRWLNWDKVL